MKTIPASRHAWKTLFSAYSYRHYVNLLNPHPEVLGWLPLSRLSHIPSPTPSLPPHKKLVSSQLGQGFQFLEETNKLAKIQ